MKVVKEKETKVEEREGGSPEPVVASPVTLEASSTLYETLNSFTLSENARLHVRIRPCLKSWSPTLCCQGLHNFVHIISSLRVGAKNWELFKDAFFDVGHLKLIGRFANKL